MRRRELHSSLNVVLMEKDSNEDSHSSFLKKGKEKKGVSRSHSLPKKGMRSWNVVPCNGFLPIPDRPNAILLNYQGRDSRYISVERKNGSKRKFDNVGKNS